MLNLNDPQDFLRAVQAPLGETARVLSLFDRSNTDWNIEEASYISNGSKAKGKKAIVFHVFKSNQPWAGSLSDITDQGGRRKVTYTYPYQDGATNDDLGRTPETFSLNIVLHGNNYLNLYKELFLELNKPETGSLMHPVRGPIECVMKDYTIVHKSEARKAMTLSIQFIENTFSYKLLNVKDTDPTVKSALSSALQIFKDIDNAITHIKGVFIFAKQVKAAIEIALTAYRNSYALLLNKMNQTFNGGFSSNDIPGLVPLNRGGLQNEKGVLVGDSFTNVISPNDPFVNVPQAELDPNVFDPVSVSQLEKQVNFQRGVLKEIFELYRTDAEGDVIFHQDIVNLKASGIAMQEVLENGKASSRLNIKNFIVPRLMSLRECAFINGISFDRLDEIEAFNHELESINYIPKGITVRIPV